MSKKVEVEGGQTLNSELGSEWKGFTSKVEANSSTGPNASAGAEAVVNNIAVKVGAEAKANAFEYKGEGVSIDAFGVHTGVSAEAGATGIGVGGELGISAIEAEAAGLGVKLGVGIDTGAQIGLGGIEAKVLGVGFSVGKKTGISVFGNELYVDFSNMGKFFKWC